MAFGAPFGRTFQPTFDRRNAGGYWWNLFGTIPNANIVAAYQPKGAASLAASYINLVTPGTYNAAPGVAPTWDVTNGWIFDGASTYLLTGIIPITTGQLWSIFARYSGATAVGNRAIGATLTGAGLLPAFGLYAGIAGKPTYLNGDARTSASTLLAGVIGLSGNQGYLNGVADGAAIAAAAGATTYQFPIGARRVSAGGYDLWFSGYIQALVIYNQNLSTVQALSITTAMAAL